MQGSYWIAGNTYRNILTLPAFVDQLPLGNLSPCCPVTLSFEVATKFYHLVSEVSAQPTGGSNV